MLSNKKRIEIFTIIILLGALIGSLIYLVTYEPPKKGNEYFTDQPESWIEDRYETEQEGDIEIDIHKATRMKSMVDIGRQDYFIEGDIITFFYKGFYKGDTFSKLYAGDKAELINLTRGKTVLDQTAIAEERAIMRVDSKLDPTDGVIDSFILAREEDGRFIFYIFLDEDWRNNVGYTNILWGDDFRDNTKMHLREFDFSKEENGIYINRVENDVDWNDLKPVKGGMMVGEVDAEVLDRLLAYEEFNETFIMVR